MKIKRNWSAAEADEWTKEDWITIVISPIAYMLVMIGIALSCLLLWIGFLTLAGGIFLIVLMHWVIDPKLKAISDEYEDQQKTYIQSLERRVRWETQDEH
jgi:hypothetical protein